MFTSTMSPFDELGRSLLRNDVSSIVTSSDDKISEITFYHYSIVRKVWNGSRLGAM
jgi:hypothetical protein